MDTSLPSPQSGAASSRVIAGKYHLLDRLGQGGLGEVYRAMQSGLGREVALKVIRGVDDEGRARFLREARIAAEIRHPCVIAIHDAGVDDDGTPYCAMELLEGETLAARIARDGRLAPKEAVGIIALVASALQAVHKKGFLHRDVKPSNVFLAKPADGLTTPEESRVEAKLIDFGIARRVAVEPEAVRRITQRRLGAGGPATAPGMIVGTPCYLSPEQITGAPLDARSDVYALGATLYEALTGTPPFQNPDTIELLAAIVVDPVEPLTSRAPDAGIPEALDREVQKALSKDPAARHASAAELSAALWTALAAAQIEDSTPPPVLPVAPLRGRIAIALAVVAVAVALLAFLRRPGTPHPAPAPPVMAATTPPPSAAPEAPPPPPEAAPTAAATTAAAPAAPMPRAKTAHPTVPSASAAPAPSAPPPAPSATSMRIDDLKVPY